MKEQKTINHKDLETKYRSTVSSMTFDLLVRLLIYIAISIGIYLIIVASQPLEQVEQQYETIMKQVGCIAMGCMISCYLKVLPQFWINRL